MSKEEMRDKLSLEHHAVLFAYIARALVNRVREVNTEQVLRKAVGHYGEQRGKRMFLRTQKYGYNPSILNYMVFGEWRAGEGDSEVRITEVDPHLKFCVLKCPWYDAWDKEGLVNYGKYYCMEIDDALMYGYNPKFSLRVLTTKPNDNEDCKFVFHEAYVDLVEMDKRKNEIGDSAVMGWDYHLGHLYKSVGEIVEEELGEIGRSAMRAALGDFSEKYGQEAAEIVVSFKDVDFDQLP